MTAKEYLKKLDEESGTTWTEDDESICKAFTEFAKIQNQIITDEEIEIVALDRFMKGKDDEYSDGFAEGAKWYREQLKQIQ
jgi:hypothetical protein